MNLSIKKLKSDLQKVDIFHSQKRIIDKIEKLTKDISIIKAYEKKILDMLYSLDDRLPVEYKNERMYMYECVKHLHELLFIRDPKGHHLVRMGGDRDGGYVMIDDFSPEMIVYSFGIGRNVSWEADLAKQGIQCFMYDHTIKKLPQKHKLFHWHKAGICGNEPVKDCKTLDEFIKINGHEGNNNLILKMDVEGAEWEAIVAAKKESLLQFKQLVFEFHGLCSKYQYDHICSVLEKINESHQVVHVHGTNYDDYILVKNIVMPCCLEVTYARKNDYDFIDNKSFYPTPLDRPDDSSKCDIPLGIWNNV